MSLGSGCRPSSGALSNIASSIGDAMEGRTYVRRRVCVFDETGTAYRSFVGLLSVRVGVGLGLARAAM